MPLAPRENISIKQVNLLQKKLGVPEIFDCGFLRLDDWTSSRSFGSFWHLYWNSSAGAGVTFEGKRILFRSKTVYLIPAHTLFSTALTKPLWHFYIDFSLGGDFELVKKGIYEFPADYLREVLPRFVAAEEPEHRTRMILDLVWHHLAALPEEAFEKPETKRIDSRIARAIRIMENNLGSINTVSEVCAKVGLSPTNFYLLFKKETNKKPNSFLTHLRLGQAQFLLVNTNASIDEIASSVGFADRYHFSKRFKQFVGVTPVQYRNRTKKEPEE
ncbi:MAG: helix-turn-helix transcriptional regulator [Lentisphaeria bacterium]|nr:helix-turn-helix transcriptional regulator [Lentisphaeria bacterium]